jgi:hypothetical protein
MNLYLRRFALLFWRTVFLPIAAEAQYKAERIGDVIKLSDVSHKTSVSIRAS